MLEFPDDIASLNVKHSFLSKIRQTDGADKNGCIDRDIKASTVCALNALSAARAYLRGGGFRGFKHPPKFSDFFLKSEGKEIERKRKKRMWGGGVGVTS